MNGVLIASLYAPNGNPQPGPKFNYKLAWLKRLDRARRGLSTGRCAGRAGGRLQRRADRPDIYPHQSYAKDALVQPQSRAAVSTDCSIRAGSTPFARCIRMSRCTPFGTTCETAGRAMRAFGSIICCLSPGAAKRLAAAGVDRDVRGKRRRQRPCSGLDPATRWRRDEAGASRTPSRHAHARRRPSRVLRRRRRMYRRRPLLVIDGDLFAHRAYHALPKTILRRGKQPAGAILGFANFLLRFYEAERPRAVLVAWDTLEEPTYRHKQFAAYQSGREFDDALLEQLDLLPEFVAACGFANAKAAGYEADDFLAAAVAAEERRGGTALVASGDRDTFQLASGKTTILYPVRAGELARIGPAEVRAAIRRRPEAGAGLHRAARRPVRQAARRSGRRTTGSC